MAVGNLPVQGVSSLTCIAAVPCLSFRQGVKLPSVGQVGLQCSNSVNGISTVIFNVKCNI